MALYMGIWGDMIENWLNKTNLFDLFPLQYFISSSITIHILVTVTATTSTTASSIKNNNHH